MPKSGPIIIVEDDHDDQQLLKESFEQLKIPNILRFFDSCISALDYLLTTIERPFLIISDINLPAMSGFDFLKKIQDNHFLKMKCIPFIFFTTASNSSMIQQAYQMSVQGFFVKPLTSAQLIQTVNAMITYWKIASAPPV
jgi:CheY-like chemotaxis protein